MNNIVNKLALIVLLAVVALVAEMIGEYRGKWNTIAAYKNGQVVNGLTIRLGDTEHVAHLAFLRVQHPTLPENPSMGISDGEGVLRMLRNPKNVWERIFAYFPDLPITYTPNFPQQLPEKKVEKPAEQFTL